MAEQINAFQAEIQALEAKLEAKKREMMAAGTEAPERHVFKEVVREHTGQEKPSSPLDISGVTTKPNTNQTAATASKQNEEVLDQFVLHAFTKGIISAVAEAKKTNSPYLIDMLHDRLADEYYQKLLEARKLNLE